jgi:alkylation response protein AidB-like acyl-CoA dehydrogenase
VIDVASFAATAAEFLEANAPRRRDERRRWGEGPDDVAVPLTAPVEPEEERRQVAAARAWLRRRSEAGFGWITGPVELGGRGLTPAHERAYVELEKGYAVPDRSITRTGTHIVGPALLAHGSDEVRTEVLPAVHRGDVIVCQLFSEPDAGSDLANISTRAVRSGDGWLLTGQKIWSSGAHYADVGLCVARTSADGRRHEGLTTFLVDMSAPGLQTRRIRQMTGGAEFDEVFLDEVFVPDSRRVGAVGAGWAVTLEVLMAERAAIGDEMVPDHRLVERAIDLARHRGGAGDAVARQALVDAHARLALARLLVQRVLEGSPAGGTPGPELAMAKLALTRAMLVLGDAVGRLLGPALVADTGEWGTYAWSGFVLGVPGLRIGGGTDEILRNTLAERVLGLPREPR